MHYSDGMGSAREDESDCSSIISRRHVTGAFEQLPQCHKLSTRGKAVQSSRKSVQRLQNFHSTRLECRIRRYLEIVKRGPASSLCFRGNPKASK